jgi:hypothetical protein
MQAVVPGASHLISPILNNPTDGLHRNGNHLRRHSLEWHVCFQSLLKSAPRLSQRTAVNILLRQTASDGSAVLWITKPYETIIDQKSKRVNAGRVRHKLPISNCCR